MVRTSLPLSKTLTCLVVSSAIGDVRVADLERHVLVLFAVEPVAERDAVEVGRDGDGCARRVILFGPPVRGLVVDPVPRPGGRGVGGDDEVTFGVGLVVDGLVELRDDDGADAVGRAILQQAARGGFEIDLGLVTGGQGGEAGRLARWHAAGPAGGDRHGVGAAVAELSGRLPHLPSGVMHAGDYLAGVTAHLYFGVSSRWWR